MIPSIVNNLLHFLSFFSPYESKKRQKAPESEEVIETNQLGPTNMNIHFVLQGKGGVGKSFIAALIAQFRQDRGEILAIDTDPVNATFLGYKAFDVKRAEIMEGEDINQRNFDKLMETILQASCDDVIVDNGASSFIPLMSYMRSNGVIDILTELGHTPYIHTVVTAGQAQPDTIEGFRQLVEYFGEHRVKLMVWLNEFWGVVQDREIPFDRMPVFKQNADSVTAILTIPELKQETFGEDIAQMLVARQTFDEAINSSEYSFMARQRLAKIKNHIFKEMEEAFA